MNYLCLSMNAFVFSTTVDSRGGAVSEGGSPTSGSGDSTVMGCVGTTTRPLSEPVSTTSSVRFSLSSAPSSTNANSRYIRH